MAREIEFPKTRHIALCAVESAEADLDAAAREERADAGLVPLDAAKRSARIPRVVSVDLGVARNEGEACRAPDGAIPADGGRPVRCPSSTEGREHAGAAAAAARDGAAAIVSGLDRWYQLGARAGFCRSCELALVEALRESYGEHLEPFDALAGLREPPGGEGSSAAASPIFAGARQALRLSEPVEAAKRAVLRARDEARRGRGMEIAILGRVETLTPVALLLCRHLDGLVFDLPSLDPDDAILPLLVARAALEQRPAVAVPPAGASEGEVLLFASLAAACDTDLMLAPGASPRARAALARHRSFQRVVRERFRPTEPLLDVDLLVSAIADHWTSGAHLRLAGACAAALSRAHLQVGARLGLAPPHAPVLLIAGCARLPPAEASAVRRHVETGAGAVLIGRCAPVDDEGRAGDPVFPEAKAGLQRIGEGRLFGIAPNLDAPPAQEIQALVVRAARELLGPSRALLSLRGRGQLFARAYLDPERKLDVHLVNLELKQGVAAPAQGVLLHIAGQAAGPGRAGYWFSPERDFGRDGERISLNPSGFSVSTVLPSVGTCALLAIPR